MGYAAFLGPARLDRKAAVIQDQVSAVHWLWALDGFPNKRKEWERGVDPMLVPVFQFVLAVLCSPFVVESATVPDKALLPPSPEALKVPSYVLKDVAVVEKDYSAQCKLLNDLFERQYLRQVRLTPARYDDLDNEVQALVFVESSRSKDAVEAVGKRIFEAKVFIA